MMYAVRAKHCQKLVSARAWCYLMPIPDNFRFIVFALCLRTHVDLLHCTISCNNTLVMQLYWSQVHIQSTQSGASSGHIHGSLRSQDYGLTDMAVMINVDQDCWMVNRDPPNVLNSYVYCFGLWCACIYLTPKLLWLHWCLLLFHTRSTSFACPWKWKKQQKWAIKVLMPSHRWYDVIF